jgi:DNA-binding NarL/FixJ family response regulator
VEVGAWRDDDWREVEAVEGADEGPRPSCRRSWAARPCSELALSEREVEIARYIAAGLNAREIAVRTALSLGTVKNYTSSIYTKLGTSDRSKAIVALQTSLDAGAPQT